MANSNFHAKNNASLFVPCSIGTLSACSPRDFLTRRLAADLIAGSRPFHDSTDIGFIPASSQTKTISRPNIWRCSITAGSPHQRPVSAGHAPRPAGMSV